MYISAIHTKPQPKKERLTTGVKKEISSAGTIDHHYTVVVLATQSHENRECLLLLLLGLRRRGCTGALAVRCRSNWSKAERGEAKARDGKKVRIGTEPRGVEFVESGNERRWMECCGSAHGPCL